jgi:hypothetical protein
MLREQNIDYSRRYTDLQRAQDFSNPQASGPKGFMSPASTMTWRQQKKQHVQSQRSAFVRKKDNPFANYKHDPNDAESRLEQLSSQKNSIIPTEELTVLDREYRNQPSFAAPTQQASSDYRSQRPTGRRNYGNNLTGRDLLAQKSRECMSYSAGPPHRVAPWTSNQSSLLDSQRRIEFSQANAFHHLHSPDVDNCSYSNYFAAPHPPSERFMPIAAFNNCERPQHATDLQYRPNQMVTHTNENAHPNTLLMQYQGESFSQVNNWDRQNSRGHLPEAQDCFVTHSGGGPFDDSDAFWN